MKEVWERLVYNNEDYGDYYEISNMGQIRNANNKKIIKQTVNHNGYYVYTGTLGRTRNYKCFRIHRAVGCTFIPNPHNKEQVNRKDGNKANNCVTNLEWNTPKENTFHAKKTGLKRNLTAEDIPHSKGVVGIDKNGKKYSFNSIKEAERYFNLSRSKIPQCCNGTRATCGGMTWKWR